jgi:hypothetical protein
MATLEKEKGGHTDRAVQIIVNGRKKEARGGEICFGELLSLAFDPVPTGDFICFTMTYRRGHGHKPEGTLSEGQCTKLKEGMIFNVTTTDKS